MKTLPRVREAIEAELYEDVDAEIAFTAAVLDAFADYLNQTLALVNAGVELVRPLRPRRSSS